MAVSPGLAWSLANNISQAEFDQNLLEGIKQGEAQGLTDAQFESLMNQWGYSADDVARVTQATPDVITARMEAATPTTAAEIAFNNAAMAELAQREAEWARQQQQNVIINNQNIANNQTGWAAQQRQNELKWAEQQRLNAENWAKQQAANEAAWAAQQAARAQVNPFMNATQGFAQNFQNYQSIPIGAQYNPGVTAGGVSPYNQVMSQMRPVGNPYANVQGGQPMGGYDPGLYDPGLLSRFVAERASDAAAQRSGGQGTDGQISDGMAEGGLVDGGLMFGANPPGPDDGAVNLQKGEYVIKKSSVNKYGKGLLDMINEGKIPAKKIKSLLD